MTAGTWVTADSGGTTSEAVIRDARRRQLRRRIGGAAVLTVAAVLGLFTWSSWGSGPGGSPGITATWRSFGSNGVSVRYPAGWHVTTRILTTITEPVQRFAIYSGSMPHGVAIASPRADQALAIVMEQTTVSSADLKQFPRRPKRFTVSRLGGMESFAGSRWAERVFRENRRAFCVFVWVGTKDGRQLPTLLNALNSLRIAP
jgi:hypothetical protein